MLLGLVTCQQQQDVCLAVTGFCTLLYTQTCTKIMLLQTVSCCLLLLLRVTAVLVLQDVGLQPTGAATQASVYVVLLLCAVHIE